MVDDKSHLTETVSLASQNVYPRQEYEGGVTKQ
jgi:hypothetical protein